MTQPFPHTPAQLREGLVHLGVTAGQVVMLHTSVKAVGPVLGGPNTIIQSLLDVLTPDGTLMMYVGWQDIPDWLDEMTPEEAAHYRAHHPPFDPATSRAVRENSVLGGEQRAGGVLADMAGRSPQPERREFDVGRRCESCLDHGGSSIAFRLWSRFATGEIDADWWEGAAARLATGYGHAAALCRKPRPDASQEPRTVQLSGAARGSSGLD